VSAAPFLDIQGLAKDYPRQRGLFRRFRGSVPALSGVDLAIERGETLALVGESGSGKSTLARCVLRVLEPSAGRILLDGEDLTALRGRALRLRRRRFQAVFQDPAGSLDPRQRVRSILGEPLALHTPLTAAGRRERVGELLASVGLPPSYGERFPHQLSGGERQRVGIARALAPAPELLVADEPVSALDASLRSQVLDLLVDLRERYGLTLLLISHDLRAVERLADRVAVLYLGRVVERAARRDLLALPLHPYTRSLLAAAPSLSPRAGRRGRRPVLPVSAEPSPLAQPEGCPYHPRCPAARERCRRERPDLVPVRVGREVACFYPEEFPAAPGP